MSLFDTPDYDLGFGMMGNGTTVWDIKRERDNDYLTVAHIGEDGRTVTIYDDTLPHAAVQEIHDMAAKDAAKAQSERPLREIYDEAYFAILDSVRNDSFYMEALSGAKNEKAARDACAEAVEKAVGANAEQYPDFARIFSYEEVRKRLITAIADATFTPHENTSPKKAARRNTIEHKNYRALRRFAPEITGPDFSYVRFEAGEGFDPLYIEKIGENRLAIAHFYTQNGDLMRDPEIEFVIDHDAGTLSARTFRNDGLGVFREYERYEGGELFLNRRMIRDANNFTSQWLKNNLDHGYARVSQEADHEDAQENARPDYTPTATPDPVLCELLAEQLLPVAQMQPLLSALGDDADNAEIAEIASRLLADIRYSYSTAIDLVDCLSSENGLEIVYQSGAPETHFFAWDNVAQHIRYLYSKNELVADKSLETAGNFHITDDRLGEGGLKTKYGFNAAAIRVLKGIEAENRFATPEEQEILSRYVGWGSMPQAFSGEHEKWAREYAELKELLDEEEYAAAKASTLNAHFTSPIVIRAMYETLDRLGFAGGTMIDPGMGVGNFFGLLPESMANTKLYGVELDSIAGRIAKQLYPDADIQITGFEKTNFADSSFDIAIGNVPFGGYRLFESRYNKHNFNIHEHFFAKSLDLVRPGGIVAFVTSAWMMDKRNPAMRRYIAERAELLGAVRLPNTAFKANAGTEVTADILFFQRRERPMVAEPDWVHLGLTGDNIPINSYFADNPHMVLGKIVYSPDMYGSETDRACVPLPGSDLATDLRNALPFVQGEYIPAETTREAENGEIKAIPADPAVKNYSYTIVDDMVYFRENSIMEPVLLPETKLERIRGLIGLRDITRDLIDYQLQEYDNFVIMEMQKDLDAAYDAFVAKHGRISSRANKTAFSDDSSYYLLCSLEINDEEGNFDRKADMFSKRTVRAAHIPNTADNSADALLLSLSERARVDLGYMQALTGFSEEKIIGDLRGVIFRDLSEHSSVEFVLENCPFVTADEYLSGHVRQKLNLAKEIAESYPDIAEEVAPNIEGLEKVQPRDLEAGEIAVRLGSAWIAPAYYEKFLFHLLPISDADNAVEYSEILGEWKVGKSRANYYDSLSTEKYGTPRMSAYRILEETLNLRDARVFDTVEVDGKEKRVLNQKETILAQQKQDLIKEEFGKWIFADPQRRAALVEEYNWRFNSVRNRHYNGDHLTFPGMSPEIKLMPHQKDAVARILYGGKNTLLAHEVGAGKTFEIVAAAMESRRLGLSGKNIITVPNHLTEQWGAEFLTLYPSANILVATGRDFEKDRRRKFCSRIATGDYDAVILGHSQFEKIPVSIDRQIGHIEKQVSEIMAAIAEEKARNDENWSVKQMEGMRKSLEARQKILLDTPRDDTIFFEQLGADKLYVDEAHLFKNLGVRTKMRNVAGISTTSSLRANDMFMKCRYLDEITDGSGVVFATGTPISNSMTEAYVMMRYLQYKLLEDKNLLHFDTWASIFGETTTGMELAPDGSGYRLKTRFARFFNLPELMTLFRECADIRLADSLDLQRPEAHYETIVSQPSKIQKLLIQGLSERAKEISGGNSDTQKDNMLVISGDGRKIGLDQRLILPGFPDDPESKVNACVRNVHSIWKENSEKKLTQILFCDFSTPKNGVFNLYHDIRDKLEKMGVPKEEIAFIHDFKTELQKKELFARVRNGSVRIMMGSTQKCGAGTNCQDLLVAQHDLDFPWRPADLDQRAGRAVRQGNSNSDVFIYRYVTEGTFDAYILQLLENKAKFIAQIMRGDPTVRECGDIDETVLSYAEIKALAAGDPLILEKVELERDVARLQVLKSNYTSQKYGLEDKLLTEMPLQEKRLLEIIAGLSKYADIVRENPKQADIFPTMTIDGKRYADKEQAAKVLTSLLSSEAEGSYRGFPFAISKDGFGNPRLTLGETVKIHIEMGSSHFGNLTRLDNAIDSVPKRLADTECRLEALLREKESIAAIVREPFSHETELTEKTARLREVDGLLMKEKDGKNTMLSACRESYRILMDGFQPVVSGESAGMRLIADDQPDIVINSLLSDRVVTVSKLQGGQDHGFTVYLNHDMQAAEIRLYDNPMEGIEINGETLPRFLKPYEALLTSWLQDAENGGYSIAEVYSHDAAEEISELEECAEL